MPREQSRCFMCFYHEGPDGWLRRAQYTDVLVIDAPRMIPGQLACDLGIEYIVNETTEWPKVSFSVCGGGSALNPLKTQVIQVPEPPLQTIQSLREKVLGDKHQAFIERQRRKAGA
jgi:hypothetical protein